MPDVRERAVWGAVAALLLLLCTAGTAQAGARRPGLAGNLLIEDPDDVFLFPQRLTAYPNLVTLAYGGTAGTGNGLFTLGGDGWVFGVALHRGDVLAPHAYDELAALDGPSTVFPGALLLSPATLVDGLFALDLGASEIGLRIGAGAATDSTERAGVESGLEHSFGTLELGFGHGVRGESVRIDASLSAGFQRGESTASGVETAEGTIGHLSLLGRAFVPIDAALDLGLLGQVGGNSGAYREGTGDERAQLDQVSASISAGAGPALRLGRASVAGYALLRFSDGSEGADLEEEDSVTSRSTSAVPALQLALEVPIGSWFTVRSGAEYAFEINARDAPEGAGSDEREGRFNWNLGFGLSAGDFRFDASLQHGFVTGGPSFIGGGEPGFLAIASASYSFDAARKSAVAASVAQPAPSPAPAVVAPPVVAPASPPPPETQTAPAPPSSTP